MYSIEVNNLSKAYSVYKSASGRLAELLTFQLATLHKKFWALRDVSFSVEKGELFGILGKNGSGKSTLLQIVAGILAPTQGSVEVNGRISAILELGAGFNGEFSGRENVYLNAAILGFSRAQIDKLFPAIETFAEIGDFIDQPVKTYSSGMVMRLAFAVAVSVDPEILIVDEALAVGDVYFRQRCLRRIHELRKQGTTILFVSHQPAELKSLCDRCMWLKEGKVEAIGSADAVIGSYLAATVSKTEPKPAHHRFGSREAEIIAAGISKNVVRAGDEITVHVTAQAHKPIPSPIIGFTVRNPKGEPIWATNTFREDFHVPRLAARESISCNFSWQVPDILPDRYTITVGFSNGTLLDFEVCDCIEDALVFSIEKSGPEIKGYLRIPCEVSLTQ